MTAGPSATLEPAHGLSGDLYVDSPRAGELVALRQAIHGCAHMLPEQSPLHAFVHHNTLHAFQDRDFDTAVTEAAALFGTEPYQSEAAFRAHIAAGRISRGDIEAVLFREPDLQHPIWPEGPRLGQVLRFRLEHSFPVPDTQTIAWMVSEGELFDDFHPVIGAAARADWQVQLGDAPRTLEQRLKSLWQCLLAATPKVPPTGHGLSDPDTGAEDGVEEAGEHGPVRMRAGIRLRDHCLQATGIDIDDWVKPLLIRLSGAFLDQGVADVNMPGREQGFMKAIGALYRHADRTLEPWLGQLPQMLVALEAASSEEVILWALNQIGIAREDWQAYLTRTGLVLRGWAGMFHQYEVHPERLPVKTVPATLVDYLAVQLLLETAAAGHALAVAKSSGRTRALTLSALAQVPLEATSPARDLRLAYEAFVTAQGLRLDAGALVHSHRAAQFVAAVAQFDELTRRRLLHAAYERNYRVQILDGLLAKHPARETARAPVSLQAVFCMDEREESLRRHLEEIMPGAETFGFAGFFGIPMSYQGMDDIRPRPLCPVVIQPRHLVLEVPTDAQSANRYRKERQRRGRTGAAIGQARDSVFRGGSWAILIGSLKIIPLIGLSLFPRRFAKLTHHLHELGLRRPDTRLQVESTGEVDAASGLQLGFTVPEMTAIVSGMLRTMGLTRDFAPVVMIVGHGSSSLNNPHEAAHDCGATGGGRGGPNARAFAVMANHPAVRKALGNEGFELTEQTWFVGAYHNTCDDSMVYYDTDLIPSAQMTAFETARTQMAEACRRDAHERCRRFESAPRQMDTATALLHAEEHANDLGQPRPEYGHATNAVCVIGRRELTRGLYLDRRAFLISYDPVIDPEGFALGRLLAAAGPVGAGISLEYYFSFVDPTGYGCGTKLPHNITGLIGVMDGHASDLRTGLPWQMVEIHEPMRLLIVTESTPEILARILEQYPEVAQLVMNRWVQVACIEPETGVLHTFENGRFEPYRPRLTELPSVNSSLDYYPGHRGHLSCVRINKEDHHAA